MDLNKRIKAVRLAKGLTLAELAEKTGFTKGYLSRIENADAPPPFATVQRLAAGLGMEMGELVRETHEKQHSPNIDLVSAAEREAAGWDNPGALYTFQPLVNSYQNKYMSPFLFRVKTGSTEPGSHDSEEFVYVLQGEVTLHYEGSAYRLRAGDSFYLYARIRHHFENIGEETALLIAVHYNYRRF